MSKIKIIATKPQVIALIEILNEFSAGLGSGENESERIKQLKLVDRLLNTNGISRDYQ